MRFSDHREGTILIVDDEPHNVQVVGTMLAAFGYDFMVANDGEQALKRVRARLPDLVLLDVRLPNLDGFDVCREFREIEGMEEIPIIFLSAKDDKNSIVKALEVGGVDYVTKPFNKAELLARVRTHMELKAVRDERTELLQNTERFLEVMAHDLKNWVGSARFSAQLLAGMNDLPEKASRATKTIEEATEHSLAFIQDFLSNAREAHTEVALKPQSFDLRPVIQELIGQYEGLARKKRISLDLKAEDREQEVYSDRSATRRILENLVSNAIKFSDEGASVVVTVEEEPAEEEHSGASRSPEELLVVRVSDEGPGFSEDDLANLFQPYKRLSARPTGGEVSTGLGLSIVKQLCDRLDIDIGVESNEPEKGATMVLRFPTKRNQSREE